MKKLHGRFEAILLSELPKNIVLIEAETLPRLRSPKGLERSKLLSGRGHRLVPTPLKKVGN